MRYSLFKLLKELELACNWFYFSELNKKLRSRISTKENFCSKGQICTKSLLHEGSILNERLFFHEDTFSRVEIFYIFYLNFLLIFFSIIVTPNPYPRSVIFLTFFLFFYKSFFIYFFIFFFIFWLIILFFIFFYHCYP